MPGLIAGLPCSLWKSNGWYQGTTRLI
jgi:hypothetical protein